MDFPIPFDYISSTPHSTKGTADYTKHHIALRKLIHKTLYYGQGLKRIEKTGIKQCDILVERLRQENEKPVKIRSHIGKLFDFQGKLDFHRIREFIK